MIAHKAAIALVAMAVGAATANAQPLEKRFRVGMQFGDWHMSGTAENDSRHVFVQTTAGDNGFIGGVNFGYWLSEGTALDFSVGVLRVEYHAEFEATGASTEASYVTTVLAGVRQYFPRSTYGGSVRPFVLAAVGSFAGSQSEAYASYFVTVESRTESALGGQLAGGVDFLLSKRFIAELTVGANVMADFPESIGGRFNYGGPFVSAGFGILFGHG